MYISGDDVLHQQDVGLATNISLDNLSLKIGTRYYVTVVSVNTVGLHTALVSDGFVIDTDNPIDGVVFNTKHHKNTAFQRSTNTFEMSWHGFQDHYSGIKYYMVAILNVKEYNSTNISFTNVGLLTAYTFTNQNLKHGESYSGIVKAVDAAGHESVTVFSPAQLVDETPPKGFNCESTQQLSIDISYKVNNDDYAVVANATFIKDNVYYISGTIRSLKYDLYPVLTIDRFSVPLPFEKQNGGALRYYYTFISQVTGVQSIEIAVGTTVEDEMLQHLNVEECILLSTNNSNAISLKQIGPYSVAVSLLIMDAESEIRTVSSCY
ncbi:hypothetical protein DPMN_068296 [Dreissena polymorpha]|uniref:Uncharacterized protein n=1 Tax=Dreissena polymorpha TaxID=45954 RepID=A0A9D3Z1Z9_DREPO|nr:hypothetical protein DPMN_068296 [Dreissena polymorpha]